MKKENKFEVEVGGKKIEVKTNYLAEQAAGTATVQMGETILLTTAQIGQDRADAGFFPLTCEFEERHYAAGKILGSRFVRREGRPTTNATLNGRMIDRTIRPLFPANLTREIQVIATCLSWDAQNDLVAPGILGASLSLGLSEIPWKGPVGAVRVAKMEGKLIANPSYEEREKAEVDIIFVGHNDKKGEVLVNMIDGKANIVKENEMIELYNFAVPLIKEIIVFQEKIIKELGKEKLVIAESAINTELEKKVKSILKGNLEKALYNKDKRDYKAGLLELEEQVKTMVVQDFGEENIGIALQIIEKETNRVFKENILEDEKRPDARKIDQVREIETEVALLPRAHGSGLFSRGLTKVLNVLTLGSPGDQLLEEGMEVAGKKRFMHHYNFPPYSVGEVKRMGSTGRREIGHGMLAEKAILPLLPSIDDFPYTIRAVSEVVSSNGSSSMASVSATSLALMDAGVPLKEAAAGIAMGLVRGDKGEFKVLTDIQGPEDHYGEMDFKVAGTAKGIWRFD